MRNELKIAAAVLLGAAAITISAPRANADNWDKKTTFTFSGPVEIPGVHEPGWQVLPAGTYVFKLMNSQSNRHIVQIFNQDQSSLYATVMTIPDTRVERTDDTVITFRERPEGQPAAIHSWFYPGSAWGDEFIYPKFRDTPQLTASNYVPDLPAPVAPAPVMTEPAPVVETPAEIEAPIQEPVVQTAPSPSPEGDQVMLAQAQTPAPPPNMRTDTPAPAADTTPSTLPKTASSLGLTMLSGLLALGGAFGVRSLRQRTSKQESR